MRHPNANSRVEETRTSILIKGGDEGIAAGSRGPKKARPLSHYSLIMSVLSGIIVFFYHSVLGQMANSLDDGSVERMSGKTVRGLSGEAKEGHRQLMGLRMMVEVIKETWPECVDNRMNGFECKNFIDDEILSFMKGDDRLTRTVLANKRSLVDIFYNSVVIPMDDEDLVIGRDGDGMVYYDFPWMGSGVEAEDGVTAEIPPVIARETGSEEEPLLFEDEPVLVEGATLKEALNEQDEKVAATAAAATTPEGESTTPEGGGTGTGTETTAPVYTFTRSLKPIAGGVVINPDTPNCDPDHDEALANALAEARASPVPTSGERTLPPFDCSCLNGYSCCLLIKTLVRDADVYNKAIQCHLNYSENTAKSKLFDDARGKKVKIYTNHNFVVSKVPFVEGSWEYEDTTTV